MDAPCSYFVLLFSRWDNAVSVCALSPLGVCRALWCLGVWNRQEGDSACGLSSSGVSELALFQELHSYSNVVTGHSTILVPLAVVLGTGIGAAAGN